MKAQIFETIDAMEGMVHGFDFARVISLYWEAYRSGDEEIKSKVLRWFRGEYATKTEAKRDLGVQVIIGDEDWYDYMKLFAAFFVKAGYKGLLLMIDELVNIFKIPNAVTRQYNYEKILTMYNDVLQGKARSLGIFMGATPACIEDTRRVSLATKPSAPGWRRGDSHPRPHGICWRPSYAYSLYPTRRCMF